MGAAPPPLSAGSVAAAFSTPPRPTRPSVGYLAAVVAVAVAMAVLPLIYLTLVACTTWAWWWYVRNGGGFVERFESVHIQALLLFGPLVIGPVLVFFLLKPLLARPAKPVPPKTLDLAAEPTLFAFVDALCAAQGVPPPRRIDVVLAVNASASFRRGQWSLSSRDLVLTLGLPLVACLDARQLAAVIAHEFGHFSQGLGMRAAYLIETVERWFARVVFERDRWDDRLARWAERTTLFWTGGVILHSARAFVGLTRGVLYVLMLLGHAISATLSRQMELDADANATRIAGSRTFEQALQRLALAEVAHGMALGTAYEMWPDGRLPDDIPGLARRRLAELDAETRSGILAETLAEKPGRYGTHPALGDRLRRASELNLPGVVDLEEPAASLFADFRALSRELTRATFEPQVEDPGPTVFVDLDEVGRHSESRASALEARREVFGTDCPPPLHLAVPPAESRPDAGATIERWRDARDAALRAPEFDVAPLWAADDRLARASAAEALLEEGEKSVPRSLKLTPALAERPQDQAAAAGEELDRLAAEHRPRGAARLERARLALGLAASAGCAEEELAGTHALRGLADLTTIAAPLEALRRATRALDEVAATEDVFQPERKVSALNRLARRVRGHLRKLQPLLRELPYTFEHARGAVDLAEVALREIPDDLNEFGPLADHVLARLFDLHERCLGNLAAAVLAIEAELERSANTLDKHGTDGTPATP